MSAELFCLRSKPLLPRAARIFPPPLDIVVMVDATAVGIVVVVDHGNAVGGVVAELLWCCRDTAVVGYYSTFFGCFFILML